MIRPCFLVVDREYAGNISTRKLVIEMAKFNVLTSYSGQEALDTLDRFPAVDGVVLDGGIDDLPCAELVAEVKRRNPRLPVIVVAGRGTRDCGHPDYEIESFEPAMLLDLLKTLQPNKTAAIEDWNEALSLRPATPRPAE